MAAVHAVYINEENTVFVSDVSWSFVRKFKVYALV
jgi:hypothetical protein